jgi:5-methylcytosine-specific restriction endonuclease McrA
MRYKKGNRWKSSGGEIRYRTWRTSVFKLNRGKKGLQRYYVCEKCDKKRKTTRALHAHHIYSWEEYPKKRYVSKNGVVLCIKCHNAFHRKYGYKSITEPERIIDWLGKHRSKTIREYIEYENKKSSKK